MPKCAFLTIENTEGWFIDDDLVHAPLKALGWGVENVPWNRDTDWNMLDIVVIRSPWDYQAHFDRFVAVLEKIEASRATLLNGIDVVKWNINKNYLFELESKGVELVPTIKHNTPDSNTIIHAFDALGTSELIIKPMIGANADDTFRIPKGANVSIDDIASRFAGRECMIQPFMNQIITEGEFSLMYFEGELSHTILKTVGSGDFRVQEEHGGGVIPIPDPEPGLVEAADKAMAALPSSPMYARVDLVRTPANSFALMELELIEPCLYFRFDEASPRRFAACIDQYR